MNLAVNFTTQIVPQYCYPIVTLHLVQSHSVTQKSVSQENVIKKRKTPAAFHKAIGSNKRFTLIENNFRSLTGHNWQNWKRVLLSYYWHEIYRVEAVGLKNYNYTRKITIFLNKWNLGQFLDKSIFSQKLLNWSSNLRILFHTCYS